METKELVNDKKCHKWYLCDSSAVRSSCFKLVVKQHRHKKRWKRRTERGVDRMPSALSVAVPSGSVVSVVFSLLSSCVRNQRWGRFQESLCCLGRSVWLLCCRGHHLSLLLKAADVTVTAANMIREGRNLPSSVCLHLHSPPPSCDDPH